jgi:thiol-disulfide isomerase/thioredoxin
MRWRTTSAVVAASVLALGMSSGLVRADEKKASLKVGDPAPAMAPGKWVKGDPIKEFEKGKVYVVEFWATWCGPCKVSIPHLTELQKKFPDVAFTGVSVWEHESDASKVEPFVKEMGDKMDYRVAVDDAQPKGTMATTWMKAANRNGIPTAFIVDRDSKIAWIGHPMAGLEEILTKVQAGNFDAQAQASADAQKEELQKAFQTAMSDKDYDAALAALDNMEKSNPQMADNMKMTRFQVLIMKKDFDAAGKVAEAAAKSAKDPQMQNALAWMIVINPQLSKDHADLALATAEKAVKGTDQKDAAILDTLAHAYMVKGNQEKAVSTEEMAVEKATDARMKSELQKALEKFKAGKQDIPEDGDGND